MENNKIISPEDAFKWAKEMINKEIKSKVDMEDKLLTLKEQFCNWYCENRYGAEGEGQYIQDPCNFCMVYDYIDFVRDELK